MIDSDKIFEVVLCNSILEFGGPLDKHELVVMRKAVRMYRDKLIKEVDDERKENK